MRNAGDCAMNALVFRWLQSAARFLPPMWRVRLRRTWTLAFGAPHATGVDAGGALEAVKPTSAELVCGTAANSDDGYAFRAAQEVSRFSAEEVVHDLPTIFHYWSNTHLRPHLERFGFSYPEDFFARQIEHQARAMGRPIRVVSIGSGNCDSELAVAKLLMERGVDDFRIECLDITPAMLHRGRMLAETAGLGGHFAFTNADFNHWEPSGRYDVVIANQSLHHVTRLEDLFDSIRRAIGDEGIFITSDMIGRNGHMRWPEALEILQEFWDELPTPYRYNRQLRRQENVYGNWDCSVEGFEGVRAQDILALLVERFGFDFFFAYGNLIDPFIDRGFGPNFDASAEWDRNFIDRVHARDEREMLEGRIKPTHMLATMRADKAAVPRVWCHLTPGFCVRPTA